MPGKSKRGKGKRFQQTKNTINIQRKNNIAAPAPAATVSHKAAAPVQTVQGGKITTTAAAAKTNQYIYIPGDLRNIGILTGIIFVILIILYFILS